MTVQVILYKVYLVTVDFMFMFVWLNLSRIADAEENLGESEVREAHLAKSLLYIRTGDKVWTCISISLNFEVSFEIP